MQMTEGGIGERLRSAREARGLTLDEIEAATRVRRRYLEALEAEAFDQLPGPAYVKGFLRTYASYLGLPAEDLVGLCPDLRVGPAVSHSSPVEVRITPATPPSRARRVITAIAVVLVIGLAALAYTLYGQIRQFAQTPPPAPGTAASSPRAPAHGSPAAHPPGAPPAGAPGPGSPAAPGPAPQPGQAAPTPAPAAPASPGGALSAAPQPPAAAASPLSLVVAASDRSWVRTVADGVTVYEGFLNAGDRQTWQARHQLTIRGGNAGALDMTLNGHPLGRLGKPGDVVERTFVAGAPVSP
jgi:cytoskeleton protein RodZ